MNKVRFIWMVLLLCVSALSFSQVVVNVIPKTTTFPVSGLSYVNSPGRYFQVIINNNTDVNEDVYLALSLKCNFSASGQNVGIVTSPDAMPSVPVRVGARQTKVLTSDELDRLVSHLGTADVTLEGIDKSDWQTLQRLPEGQYELCVTPYRWKQMRGMVQPLGEKMCTYFSICYSGSAPEFVMPVMGQGNWSVSSADASSGTPGNNINVLPAQRQVAFRWTGVISNCLQANKFNYYLKIVKLLPGQNVRDAINHNATVATINTGRMLYYIHDTLLNRHFRLENGQAYAAQVQAVPTTKSGNMADILLSNDGKSQVITFSWATSAGFGAVGGVDGAGGGFGQGNKENEEDGDAGVSASAKSDERTTKVDITSEVSDNKEDVLKDIRNQYLILPAQDKKTIDELVARVPTEKSNVPAGGDTVKSVKKDGVSVYKVSKSATFSPSWIHTRSDSIETLTYNVSLYKYIGGDPSLSMYNFSPLKSEKIVVVRPGTCSFSNYDPYVMSQDWADALEVGEQYIVKVDANFTYRYASTTNYKITEYIDGVPVTDDSTSVRILTDAGSLSSDVVFQWGVDSSALIKMTPAQFTNPSKTFKDDDEWEELPEYVKTKAFSFKWKSAETEETFQTLAEDSVKYDLFIYELKNKQTLKKAVSGTPFYKEEGIADLQFMSDSLYKKIEIGKNYVARLKTKIATNADDYLISNEGFSEYAVFKFINADVDPGHVDANKVCFPMALDSVSKDTITPPVDSLVKNNVKLMMGEFPLVMQNATLKNSKYKGDGYVIFDMSGLMCRIKVNFDSVMINKDYRIIRGSAKGATEDEQNYLQMNLGFGWTDWTDDKLAKATNYLGSNKMVKEYVDLANKYAPIYDMIRSSIVNKEFETPIMTLPLALDSTKYLQNDNIKITIGEMYFSPVTSLMNIVAVFSSHKDNIYLPLIATNVCMSPTNLFGNVDKGIDLYLGRDYEFNVSDGKKFRFKAGKTMGDTTSATFISIDTAGFRCMNVVAEMDFPATTILKADLANGGNVTSGPVRAKFETKIYTWNDWVAKASMDPFVLASAKDWTFVPTGKGIIIDHSDRITPGEVTFPKDYINVEEAVKQQEEAKADAEADDDNDKKDEKKEDKKDPSKMTDAEKKKAEAEEKKKKKEAENAMKREWQGLYIDEFSVLLPDEVSNTFIAGDSAKKDSMIVYNYGVNNSKKDSTKYMVDGSRIKFSARNMVFDKDGLSVTLAATDIVKASDGNKGGWLFSLDTVAVSFVRSDFKQGCILGKLGVPLLDGDLGYRCMLGEDSLNFNIKTIDKELGLKLWVAKLTLDPASTYFSMVKNKKKELKVDLQLNGRIDLDLKKYDLPISLPGIKFEKMGMRNYTERKSFLDSTELVYDFDGLHFDAGKWSKASPQKKLFSGNVGNFNFSVNSIKPIYSKGDAGFYKAGLKFDGDMSIGTGGSSTGKIGGGICFQMWTNVKLSPFEVKGFDGQLDSIRISTHLDVFKLDGRLGFMKEDPVYGDGLYGTLGVSIIDKIDCKVAGGFGSALVDPSQAGNKDAKTYDWWFLEGVLDNKMGGIPLGAVNLTGFGGGFAYNMTQKAGETDPKKLMTPDPSKSFADKMVSTGLTFKPKKDAYFAKAGVALALANPATMNASGFMSLTISNGHFSGFMMSVDAHVMTAADATDPNNSKGSVLDVGAVIDVQNDSTKFSFNFSACAKSEIKLTSLLKDDPAPKIPKELDLRSEGELNKDYEPLEKEKKETANNGSEFGAKISLIVPVDFSFTHYKKGKSEETGNQNDWFFSIGRANPKEHRVQFSMDANLIVCKAHSKFDFYFMTGNYFPGGYQLPEIDPEVRSFLSNVQGKGDLNDDADAARDKLYSDRANLGAFSNASGFAMGATFDAGVTIDFFLYLDAQVKLGFDVALLNTKGKSCEGYSRIGKNDFYALGQIYAMIKGDVGLSLNLGFWKGKISLASAGVGALLQGGGPKPTWCYGLLGFRAELLGGMIKIKTSCDFELGDVCVPNAGNPLADVKLIESVSPSYKTKNEAEKSGNEVNPFGVLCVSSNMPWDEDVVLVSSVNGMEASERDKHQKFRFVLLPQFIDGNYTTTGSKTSKKLNDYDYTIRRDENETNIMYVELNSGGFMPDALHKIKLEPRAYEYRKAVNNSSDPIFDITTGYSKGNGKTYQFNWHNPTYTEKVDGKDKIIVKPFSADTTVYFKTEPLPANLKNQVVLTWPYNGTAYFPVDGMVGEKSGAWNANMAYIYLNNNRSDLFDKSKLRKENKELVAFYTQYKPKNLSQYEVYRRVRIPSENISYQWLKDQKVGEVSIKLTDNKMKYIVSPSHSGHIGKVELYQVETVNQAMAANDQAMKSTVNVKVSETQTTEGRDLSNVMNSNKIVGERTVSVSDVDRSQFNTSSKIAKSTSKRGSSSSSNANNTSSGSSSTSSSNSSKTHATGTKSSATSSGSKNTGTSFASTMTTTNVSSTGKAAQIVKVKSTQAAKNSNSTKPSESVLKAAVKAAKGGTSATKSSSVYVSGKTVKSLSTSASKGTDIRVSRDAIKADEPLFKAVKSRDVDFVETRTDVGKDELKAFGEDTMLSVNKKKLEDYEIVVSEGELLYTMAFRYSLPLNDNSSYNNYGELMRTLNHYKAFDLNGTNKFASKGWSSMSKYGFMFEETKTDDESIYASGVVLPPLANFVIDADAIDKSQAMLSNHKYFRQQMTEFYNNTQWFYVNKFYPNQKNGRYCGFDGWDGFRNTNTNYTRLTSNNAKWTKQTGSNVGMLNYRLYDGFNTVNGNSDFKYMWNCPVVIDIKRTAGNLPPRISPDNINAVVGNHSATYEASEETFNQIETDVQNFSKFFQSVTDFGGSYHEWGYVHCSDGSMNRNKNVGKKESLLNYLIDNPAQVLQMNGFPFNVPSLTRSLHYFNALNWVAKNDVKKKKNSRTRTVTANVFSKLKRYNYTLVDFSNTNSTLYSNDDYISLGNNDWSSDISFLWYKLWLRSDLVHLYRSNQGLNRDYVRSSAGSSALRKSVLNNSMYKQKEYKAGSTQSADVIIYYFNPQGANVVSTLRNAAQKVNQNAKGSGLKSRVFFVNDYVTPYASSTQKDHAYWNFYKTKKAFTNLKPVSK